MKKFITSFFVIIFSFFTFSASYIVVLKDGSVLKNVKMLYYKEGVYYFYSSIIGKFRVKENDVENLTKNGASVPNITYRSLQNENSSSSNNSNANYRKKNVSNFTPQSAGVNMGALSSMFGGMGGKIDPQTMNKLMENPTIQDILNDPEIMNDIKAGNYMKLMTNPKIQALMNDPDILNLLTSMGASGGN